jgi:hypothetical protein
MTTDAACPRCFLPKDDDAWACDGCGYEFRKDYDQLRLDLRARLRGARRTLLLTLLADVGITAALIYFATLGYYYVDLPLVVALIGGTGHALHRISVVRGHLEALEQRHRQLPAATALPPGSSAS